MKKSKFTETQIVAILKQADAGVPVKDICRQAGISVPTYCQGKSKYDGMEASDLKRVKELKIEVETSITSVRLVRIFEQLQRDHGLPKVLRTDNGSEFLGEAFVQWAKANDMAIQCIQPGKPNQNAYIEPFNRTFREEVLDKRPGCCPARSELKARATSG